MSDVLPFEWVTESDAGRVGGKAASLARMIAVGLPVPAGFVVTTDAYARLHEAGPRSDPDLAQAVADAYCQLGGGPVAVRSSATAEDGAEASFAGQQETYLGIDGVDAVLDAIAACWRSLHTERAVAYRRQRGIADDTLAMAVVVQVLVPADVAGVMFTCDPQDPSGRLLAVEAAWGLGEAVVSGRVTPDRFRIDRDTGVVVERHAGRKAVRVTAAGEEPVPPGEQDVFCLSDTELSRLVELGRRVEAVYADARDVEWAWAGGTLHLLQARPITATTAAEREAVRAEVITDLRSKADSRGTVWVRYNLSEVLPEPTPMTWAVISRLLAADGGFGAMNRDLGASPDPSLGSDSAFDLVSGRPMCNLSRLPRMQFARPPFEYPFADYKADPRKALDPRPIANPWRDGWRALLRLPGVILRMSRMASTTRVQAAKFADVFTKQIAPMFAADARTALERDWAALAPPALVAEFRTWVDRTLVQFARDSLKPTVFADLSWQTLVSLLTPKLGAEQAASAVGKIALGAKPPSGCDLAEGIQQLVAGPWERTAFLAQFGHRGRNEMELAQPRWSEDPNALPRRAEHAHVRPPVDLEDSTLLPLDANAQVWAQRLRTYLGLREAAKHYLLLGYAVIRRVLVELDTRYRLQGGIFYLLPHELDELITGRDMSTRIATRKRRRILELGLEVPAVLFADDLDVIGRPVPPPIGADVLHGVPLSAGTAEGAALVLTEPIADVPDEPFVLVCPSTDPAWVPLFARACGLVMETGGVLSHGAIVAREFGLPAVAGLPDATRQFRSGQHIRVDGGRGTVVVIESPRR